MLVSDLNRCNGVSLPPLDKRKVRQCRDPLWLALPAMHALEASLLWESLCHWLIYVALLTLGSFVCFFNCLLDWDFFFFFFPHIISHLGEVETHLEN